MAPQGPGDRARREPLYDVNPLTGISIEVLYMDRSLETFGRCGAAWFWWPRRRGASPDGRAIGPFATSYAAYRHAMKGGIPFVDSVGWALTSVGGVGAGGDQTFIEILCT